MLSDGPIYYCRPGLAYPEVPTTGHESGWHWFSSSGGVDYGGTCSLNTLRMVVSGNGTATIETAGDLLSRGPVNLTAVLYHRVGGSTSGSAGAVIADETQTGLAGDTFTDSGPCGWGWGFVTASWEGA